MGDVRAKAEAFVGLAKLPYEQAVRHIRDTNPSAFAHTVRNKATEVVFAGTLDGNVALIVRGLLADSAGNVKLAHQFLEMEIEAHPDLAGPPISELQINENGDVHWLDKGACDSRELGGTIRARIGK